MVWTDNQGAEGASRSGRAKSWDHCRMIHEIWLHALQNGTHVWIERVPSHDNISDSPSRSVNLVGGWMRCWLCACEGARMNSWSNWVRSGSSLLSRVCTCGSHVFHDCRSADVRCFVVKGWLVLHACWPKRVFVDHSCRSGISCYIEFVKAVVGNGVAAFPPRVEWLQAWGTMFRCQGTFSNYLGYAKVGCLLAKQNTCVFQHPAVKRAKDSVGKSERFASREKLWIRRHRIEALMRWERSELCYACCSCCVMDWCVRTMQRRSVSQSCIWFATSSC